MNDMGDAEFLLKELAVYLDMACARLSQLIYVRTALMT